MSTSSRSVVAALHGAASFDEERRPAKERDVSRGAALRARRNPRELEAGDTQRTGNRLALGCRLPVPPREIEH